MQSENVVHADIRKVAAADVGGGGLKKKPEFRRLDRLCVTGRDSENRLDHAPLAKTAGFACAGILNGIIRSPSWTAMATMEPADVIFGDGDQIDPAIEGYHQVSAPGSGEICAGDQETDPNSSPDSSAELAPSSPTKANSSPDPNSSVSIHDAVNHEHILTNQMASDSDKDSPTSPNPSVERSPPSHIYKALRCLLASHGAIVRHCRG